MVRYSMLLLLSITFCLMSISSVGASEAEVNMVALNSTGQPSMAGSYKVNIVVLTRAQWERLDASGKNQYNLTGKFCGVEYFLTSYHKKWLDAHGELNHELIIQERRAGMPPATICK